MVTWLRLSHVSGMHVKTRDEVASSGPGIKVRVGVVMNCPALLRGRVHVLCRVNLQTPIRKELPITGSSGTTRSLHPDRTIILLRLLTVRCGTPMPSPVWRATHTRPRQLPHERFRIQICLFSICLIQEAEANKV